MESRAGYALPHDCGISQVGIYNDEGLDYEVLAHSVVASLGVVLGLGYLQSLLIQNTPHGAP